MEGGKEGGRREGEGEGGRRCCRVLLKLGHWCRYGCGIG